MNRTFGLIVVSLVSGLAATIAACGSGVSTAGDGGAEASMSSGASGSSGDGGADGSSTGSDAGLDACTRAPDLDIDCTGKYGATAANGYKCVVDPRVTPPCKELTTRGCTEVCSNRCCP